MKPIIVVRHALPEDKHIPIQAHWVDAALGELGLRQARSVGARLKRELQGESCRIWSSDLRRASQTAAAIGEALGVPVQTTGDLREYKSDLDAGVTAADLAKYVPADSPPSIDLLANPKAETGAEFFGRVSRRMDKITSDGDERMLIVVAHYGANMNIINWWLQLALTPEGDTRLSFETYVASITVLKSKPNGKRCLERLNDIAHLYAENLSANLRIATSPPAAAAPETAQKK